jgi:hypothetical protein
MVVLADKMIADGVEWYRVEAIRRQAPFINALIAADEIVFIHAYRLASYDIHRLTAENDGSVMVWNRTMW